MGIYRGRVNCRKLADTIHSALIAEGYEQISSNLITDGCVYKTIGTNGTSEFYIKLKDPIDRYLSIGIYEKYEPNATATLSGTFTNGYENNYIIWNRTYNENRFEVNYIFNITKDRAIIFVEGMKAESGSINSLIYIGLPNRYSNKDIDGTFAGIGFTASGDNTSSWRALRNRAKTRIAYYAFNFYPIGRSYGWGNQLFLSPIYLGSGVEGGRGELDAIFMVEQTDKNNEIQHMDTFVKDGKTYLLISPSSYSYSNLPINREYVIQI